MTHSVHPKVFRLRELKDWDSRWSDRKRIPQYLEEDFKIRKILNAKIGKLGVEKIEIERFPGKTIVIISSSRPGLLIGRGGEGIEILRKELTKSAIRKDGQKKELKIEIKEIKDPWTSAVLVVQWVAQQIEKRVGHRRVLKQVLEKVMAVKDNKGVKVEVAGRLGGSEIARREWLKKGRLPLQTLRANIDYAGGEAVCTYGRIGIKVWIYKGDVF
jgi:small subunit ribosomal protein S3